MHELVVWKTKSVGVRTQRPSGEQIAGEGLADSANVELKARNRILSSKEQHENP